MKKFLAVVMVAVFSTSFIACTPESTTDDPTENIASPDKKVTPPGGHN